MALVTGESNADGFDAELRQLANFRDQGKFGVDGTAVG